MPLAEKVIEAIEFQPKTLIDFVAVERAGVVHYVHERAIKESPQKRNVIKGDGVDNVAIETEGVTPLNW